jgi:hypothetical protein
MATSAERMRALREREPRGLRRFTISVSEDALRVIGSTATKTLQAPTRTADPRLSAFSLATALPVSTATRDTVT